MGASLYGWRWNHKGTAGLYTAESRSLCALEILANADELADDYVATPIEVPDVLDVKVISIAELAPGWDANEATDVTPDIGTNWAEDIRDCRALRPIGRDSARAQHILNPSHPDFTRIRFSNPEPFYFDDRL